MIELLVLKNAHEYIRFNGDEHIFCSLPKASVYGLDKAEEVKNLRAKLVKDGLVDVRIMKLTIHEEVFTGHHDG